MFTAEVDLSEFNAACRDFDRELARTLHRGVDFAAQTGRDHAKKVGKFTDQTGTLRSEIRALPSRLVGAYTEAIIESPTSYASFVEEGTKAHDIYPMDYSQKGGPRHRSGRNSGKKAKSFTSGVGRGQFLRFRIGGRIIFARMVKHPGSKPYPFMGPAYIAAESALWAYFEREVPKLGDLFNG